MKMIFVGQGPFGEKVLERLQQNREDVRAVFCPKGRAGEAIKGLAEDAGLALYQPDHLKDPEVLETFRRSAPDLVILAFVTDILPEALLDVPVLGTICYHPSLLPRHRGASAINWAIIQGDTRTGLTVLWADTGIDTGPILLQKEVPIDPRDTTGSLYFQKLFPLGVEAMLEAVELIKQGRAPRQVQDETQASYEPPCDDRVAGIEWSQPGETVFNLVRGCDPQPGAYSFCRGQKIRFYGAQLVSETLERPPGEILDVRPEGLRVSLTDGMLHIGKMRGPDTGKLEAFAFAREAQLQAGMRFGGPEDI